MNWIQCLTLTFIIQATLACFITDCPHGLGKRSDISLTKKPKWKFPQVSFTDNPVHTDSILKGTFINFSVLYVWSNSFTKWS